ncbi:hypothetical protein BY996DRAFT_7253155 [Phakopsora pachyrhizi]|nr:hypothetical protein BY996DRAFT_7253155 [Phakopsora pachyrhizi]
MDKINLIQLLMGRLIILSHHLIRIRHRSFLQRRRIPLKQFQEAAKFHLQLSCKIISPNIHNPPETYGIPSSPNPGGNSSPTPKDQPNTPVGYRDQPQPTQQGEPGKPNKPVNQNQPQGRPQGKRDSPNVNPGGGYTQPTPNNQPIGPEGSGNKDQPVPLGGLNNPNEAQNWSPPHNPPKGKADSPNVIPGGGYIKHTPFNQPAVPVESNEKTQPVPQGVPNKPNEAQKQGPPQSPSKGKTDSPNVTTGGGYTQPTPNNQPTAPGKNDKFQSVPQGVPTKPNEAQNKNPPQEKVDSPNTSTGGGYTQNDPKNQPALPGTPVDQSKSIPQGVPSKTNVFIPQNPPQGKVDSPNVIPGVVNTTPTFKGQQSPSDGSNGKGGSEPTADDDCEDEIDEDVSDFNMQLPPQAPSSPNPGSNSSPTPKDQPNTNVNPGGGYTQPTPNNQTQSGNRFA